LFVLLFPAFVFAYHHPKSAHPRCTFKAAHIRASCIYTLLPSHSPTRLGEGVFQHCFITPNILLTKELSDGSVVAGVLDALWECKRIYAVSLDGGALVY
jgi:hypothetical protein